MIATEIPHSAFDKPDCRGRLDIVGRPRFVVEFVCSECGDTVFCAREDEMADALQVLTIAADFTYRRCPRCGHVNSVREIGTLFRCLHCGRNVDPAAARRPDT